MSSSRDLLFVTGAGISAESGIPTYRGIGGLYNDEDPEAGIPIETIMSGTMLKTRPELTWKHLMQMEAGCRKATFNRGHTILAEWEQHFRTLLIFTQNVDGFHFKAGSREVIEIHGNFRDLYCVACTYKESVDSYAHLELPPRCPLCGELVRPDVVLFGEMLSRQKVDRLMNILDKGVDMVFSIGTTSLFPYITLPVHKAVAQGIPTVEINPSHSDVSGIVDYKISSGAGEALEELNKQLA